MAFDWTEYLALAAWIAGQPLPAETGFGAEATLRCATSRAYYAAFCTARNYAGIHLSFVPRGDGGDHGALREHLRRTNRSQLAQTLGRLQQLRERCDYDGSDLENSVLMAQDALRQARSVLNQCR